MNNKVFVICTKEDSYILKNVKCLKKHYPTSGIIVVDSNSDNKSYMNQIRELYPDVVIADIKNRNYEYGSIMYAFNKYKDNYDIWFFIQDSLHIVEPMNLDNLDDNTVLVFDHNTSGYNSFGKHQTEEYHKQYPEWFKRLDYVSANGKLMTLWNSFIIKKDTFNKCINSDIFKLAPPAPTDKTGSMFWERAWTSVFLGNKLEMKVIIRNPLPIDKIFAKRV